MITAEEVKDLREKTGCSMSEAKRFLIEKEFAENLRYIIENGSLEEKIDFLLQAELNRSNNFFKSRLVGLFRKESEIILQKC